MILKSNTIYLRMFEPEDYEMTHIWHNDFDVQKMTCGPLKIVSKEIEKNWVINKASNNRDDLYLAICRNDNNKMVGFVSLSDFNYTFRSCSWSGIVIGDPLAHSGFEYVETGVLLISYVFDQLNMNRLSAGVLEEYITSSAGLQALTLKVEGKSREAVYKNGRYFDRLDLGLLRSEYEAHKANGDYDTYSVMERITTIAKQLKRQK